MSDEARGASRDAWLYAVKKRRKLTEQQSVIFYGDSSVTFRGREKNVTVVFREREKGKKGGTGRGTAAFPSLSYAGVCFFFPKRTRRRVGRERNRVGSKLLGKREYRETFPEIWRHQHTGLPGQQRREARKICNSKFELFDAGFTKLPIREEVIMRAAPQSLVLLYGVLCVATSLQ